MVNKRAMLKILEAFIAIVLIAGVLIVLYVRTTQTNTKEEGVYNLQKTILDEIAASPGLRDSVLNNNTAAIESFTADRIPTSFNFTIKICEIDSVCNMPYYSSDIYSSERIISANLTVYEPKKVKIFMWRT